MDPNRISLCTLSFENVETDTLREWMGSISGGREPHTHKNLQRHRSHLAGRAALNALLLLNSVDAVVQPDADYGFLRVKLKKNGSPLFANISHTRNIAVAALAASPIGVDIEHQDRVATLALTRVLTKAEKEHVKKSSEKKLGIRYWSAKEAASKAIGLGIKFGLVKIETDLKADPPHNVRFHCVGPMALKNPAVKTFSIDDYFISVCSERALLEKEPERILGGDFFLRKKGQQS